MKNKIATIFTATAFLGLSSISNAGLELHVISGADYSGFSGTLAPPEVANDGTVVLHQGALHLDNWNTWTKTEGLTPIPGVTSNSLYNNHMANDSGYLLFQAGDRYDWHTPNGIIQKGRVGYSHQVLQRISGDGKTLVGRPHSTTLSFFQEQGDFSLRLPLESSTIPQSIGINNEGTRLLISQNNDTYFVDVPDGGNFREAILTEIPVNFYLRTALSDNGLTVLGSVRNMTLGCEASNVLYDEVNGLREISCRDDFQVVGLSGDGSKVIGYSQELGTSYIWDSINGSRDLKDILLQNGYDVMGWNTLSATDISEDGTMIVGWAEDDTGEYQTFLIEVTPLCTVAF